MKSYPPVASLDISSRYIPLAAGGILANNAKQPQVTFETYFLTSDEVHWFWIPMLNKMLDHGIHGHWHSGKDFLPHSACRERLSREQRRRFSEMIERFDPYHLFDSGRIRLADMYSLHV